MQQTCVAIYTIACFFITFGAIIVTIKLYHIYESHLQVMQQDEEYTPNESSGKQRAASSQLSEDKYESWEEWHNKECDYKKWV